VALDGSSPRKALGMPENAAVLLVAASRSGRALSVRLWRTHLVLADQPASIRAALSLADPPKLLAFFS
jgi:hypothetical protein